MERTQLETHPKKDISFDNFVLFGLGMVIIMAVIHGFPEPSSSLGGKIQVYAGYVGGATGLYFLGTVIWGLLRLLKLSVPTFLTITVIAYICYVFYFIGLMDPLDKGFRNPQQKYETPIPLPMPVQSLQVEVLPMTRPKSNAAQSQHQPPKPNVEPANSSDRCQSVLDTVNNHITIRCN